MSTTALDPSSTSADPPLNDEFYRELFSVYDQKNTGYITVEKFLEISLEHMTDFDRVANEQKIEIIKRSLDPDENGKIDFEQFVVGIKRLTSEQQTEEEETDEHGQKQESEDYTLHQNQSNDFNFNDEMTDWNDLKHLSEKSKPSLLDSSGFIDFEGKSNESSLTYSNDTYNEYDTSLPQHSKKSTSSSYNSSKNDDQVHTKNSNLLNFDMFDSNNNSKSSTNSILNSNSVDDYANKNLSIEDDDPFGFGIDSLEIHRKSLINTSNNKDGVEFNSSNRRANELYNTSMSDNKLISSFENELSNEKDFFETDEKNYDELKEEQIIEKLEEKVNYLTYQNESLINEKNELTCTINKFNTENSSLYEKIREFEEVNLEQEKKIRFLYDEQSRLTELLNKANASLQEDSEAHIIQKTNLEKALSNYKEENVRYLKIISEINKNIEKNDKRLNEETEKYHQLEKSFQIIVKEKEHLKKESEILIANHLEKIQSLSKALNETRATLDLLNQKQRSNTMLDQHTTNTRMKELETEIDKLKLENVKLNGTVEELNAQIMAESGRVLMSSSMNKSDSFAAEIGTVIKDKDEEHEILEKYKAEKENNKRLQDYIEELIATIMDHNPEILEINMNNKRKKANLNKR